MHKLTPTQFPPLLQEIPDPPKELWLEGALPSFEYKYLCVVGSRKYTEYGKAACEAIIESLRGQSIVIVSGLALGIDSIAHRAALRAGLLTLAIPGSGLDPKVLYPATNKLLAKEIIENGGGLLSEYEPSQEAAPWTFPKRNRLMAGIADAVLMIEATEKSGTGITAKLAVEYNRDLMALPGSIFNPQSSGPHQWLKLGAIPVTSGEDIIDHFGLINESTTTKKEISLEELSEDERQIIELLQTEPLPRDILIQKSGLDTIGATVVISMLELKGLVKEKLGKITLV